MRATAYKKNLLLKKTERTYETTQYIHLCVNHSASFVDRQRKANTQIIETLWKQAKHGGWTSACRKGYRPPLLCKKMVTCGQAKRGNITAAAKGLRLSPKPQRSNLHSAAAFAAT
ncbi:hypothetical protein M513_09957 [Trichuris suis]|uniref:Uncharacterized protein n=1 Tax=Trichuris suis TaxID=68888 RepID=A0A085LVY7_9BILA|nr:hypothetical protein M513_09957 [Trichuris suis]